MREITHKQPAPRVGKPGGRRVGERVGDALYPTWRAGSKFWRLAQNKAYYAVLAVEVSFHFAWHSSISAAPKILVFGNFAQFRRLGGGGVAQTGHGYLSLPPGPRRVPGQSVVPHQLEKCSFEHGRLHADSRPRGRGGAGGQTCKM